MRQIVQPEVERARIRVGQMASSPIDGHNGAFVFAHVDAWLTVIASDGQGWDHVSVTVQGERYKEPDRCPTWEEMCFVKSLFWRNDETVFQLHPEKRLAVNCHPYCLHLWRPQKQDIPMPSMWMVGPKEA